MAFFASLVALFSPGGVFALEASLLTTMTVDQAREIAGRNPAVRLSDLYGSHSELYGYFLSFDSLRSLDPAVAEVLVRIGLPLSFNALTELSTEAAAILAQHPPTVPSGVRSAKTGLADLRLNGIKELSAPAAEALAAHRGKVLMHSLERLDSLPLAQKFAREPGELRLGLKQLSSEIAAELAKHRGEDVFLIRDVGRRRDGAPSVLRLDCLETLTPEAAEALALHEGVLVLNGLTTIQPGVAAALAKRVGNRKTGAKGTLVLNGLPELTQESAAALAAFPGELVLKALTEISPETAGALAGHRGRLHLTGLVDLPAATRAVLQSHPDVLLPRPDAALRSE